MGVKEEEKGETHENHHVQILRSKKDMDEKVGEDVYAYDRG